MTTSHTPLAADLRANIRAVIFDFDGVIADTEALHYDTFAATLLEEGIRIREEDRDAKYLGVTDAACFELVLREAGRDFGPEELTRLVERKSVLYRERAASAPLFRGSRRVLEETLGLMPSTIASCGLRRDIEAILSSHALDALFPRYVAGDDLDRSKPHPECFLKALELLRAHALPDLRAEECLVFEDTTRGVQAARGASMRCVAVAHTLPAETLAGADLVLPTIDEWRWVGSPFE